MCFTNNCNAPFCAKCDILILAEKNLLPLLCAFMAGYYFAIKIKALFIKVLKYYVTGSFKLQINLLFHKSLSLIFTFFNWSLNLKLSFTL